jgi:hypothetical protein
MHGSGVHRTAQWATGDLIPGVSSATHVALGADRALRRYEQPPQDGTMAAYGLDAAPRWPTVPCNGTHVRGERPKSRGRLKSGTAARDPSVPATVAG